MLILAKCHRSLKHYFLLSLIIYSVLIGFSFPVMAYHIETTGSSGIHYDEYILAYGNDEYYQWSWGDNIDAFMFFEVVSDPGDPVYDGLLVKTSVNYYQNVYHKDFYGFDKFPEYEVHFPYVSDFEVISAVPINEPIIIYSLMEFDTPGHTIIDFITYPTVLDPESGATASVWGETKWFFSAELIGPISAVPEPATMLLLGLGLLGLAGMRRKIQK